MRRKSSFKTILYLDIVAILGAMFSAEIKSAVEKVPFFIVNKDTNSLIL